MRYTHTHRQSPMGGCVSQLFVGTRRCPCGLQLAEAPLSPYLLPLSPVHPFPLLFPLSFTIIRLRLLGEAAIIIINH